MQQQQNQNPLNSQQQGQKGIDQSYLKSYAKGAESQKGIQLNGQNNGLQQPVQQVQQQAQPFRNNLSIQVNNSPIMPTQSRILSRSPMNGREVSPVNMPVTSRIITNNVQYVQQSPLSPINYQQQSSLSPMNRPQQYSQSFVQTSIQKQQIVQQQQPQVFNSIAINSPINSKVLTRVNLQQAGLNSVSQNQFLEQKIYDQFKNKKIDFQIFANNLIQKLLEFHEKLIPVMNKSKYLDITALNQYDVVVDDLNQELSIKNQTILDNIEKIKELERKFKEENGQLKNALVNKNQIQLVNNLTSVNDNQERLIQDVQSQQQSQIVIDDQERAFQKEIQCLQGFLEIKLITFLEQLFMDYHRIIREHQYKSQTFESEKQRLLKQIQELMIFKTTIIQYEEEIKLLTDTLAQRDVLIYQKQTEIQMLLNKKNGIDESEYYKLEQAMISQKEIIDNLQEQLSQKPNEVKVEVLVEDKTKIIMYENQVDLLKSQLDEKERYFNMEIRNYQEQLDQYERDLKALQQQIFEKNQEINRLQEMNQQYLQEIEEYAQEIEEYQAKKNINDDAKWLSKIAILEQEIATTNLKLKDAMIEVEKNQNENRKLSKIIDDKSSNIFDLQGQLDELSLKNKSLNQNLQDERNKNQELNGIIANEKKEKYKLRQEKEEVNSTILQLEQKVRSKDKEIDELRNEIDIIRDNYSKSKPSGDMDQKNNELQRQISRLQQEINKKDEEIKKKEREISSLQSDIRQQKEYSNNLELQVQKSRNEVHDKINQLEDTKKQYEQSQNNDSQTNKRVSVIQRKSLVQKNFLNFQSKDDY